MVPLFSPLPIRSTAVKHRVSLTALMLAALSYQPAAAQEAIVIGDGETVNQTVILDENGDSLQVEAGGTIDITGDGNAVDASANDVTITNDGFVTTSGSNGDGIVSNGNRAVIVNNGEISTLGFVATGILTTGANVSVTNNGKITAFFDGINVSGDNATVVNNGEVISADFASDGIEVSGTNVSAVNTANGLIILQEFASSGIEADGTFARGINDGTIESIQENSNGISIFGMDSLGQNSGLITTQGQDSFGINVEGLRAIAMNTGAITTAGQNADGVNLRGEFAQARNSGDLTMSGLNAEGIFGSGANQQIMNEGTITSSGENGNGIRSTGAAANVANTGMIVTSGESASGIVAAGPDQIIANTGTIRTTGIGSSGVRISDVNGDLNNSGSVVTTNEDADAVLVEGDDAQFTNTGLLRTTGIGSSGIRTTEANSAMENSGSILTTAQNADAVRLEGDSAQFTNTGLLSATGSESHAIRGLDGDESIVLGEGSVVLGAIDLGEGEDSITIEAADLSSVLVMDGVETLNIADDIAALSTQVDATSRIVNVIDATSQSVLGVTIGTVADDAHRALQGQAGTNGAWANVLGGISERGDDDALQGYDHEFAGLLAGYETLLGGNRIGFVGGVTNGEITTDNASTQLETEAVFGGAYLATTVGNFALTTSLLAGQQRNDSTRLVIDNIAGEETATGDFDSSFVSAGVDVAMQDIALGRLTLRPSAMASYTRASIEEYTESGTTNSNLTFDDRITQSLHARAQLETIADVGPVAVAFRAGIDGRMSDDDDIAISLGDGSLRLDSVGSDTIVGGFIGAHASFAQSDFYALDGDIEYGLADGEESTLSASLTVSFSF